MMGPALVSPITSTFVLAGFMLCVVVAACLGAAIGLLLRRLDDHGEQLANLQIIVAGWLPEELDEVEPAAVTDEFPVVSDETAPMDLGEQIDADHRALVVREKQTVERTVNGFTFRVWEDA